MVENKLHGPQEEVHRMYAMKRLRASVGSTRVVNRCARGQLVSKKLGGQRPAVDDVASPAPGGTRMQVAGPRISLYQGALAEADSVALAALLLGQHTSPTQAAQRAGRMLRDQ